MEGSYNVIVEAKRIENRYSETCALIRFKIGLVWEGTQKKRVRI